MGIVFITNEILRTKKFPEKGVVKEKKQTMDERNELFREKKNFRFLKRTKKMNCLKLFEQLENTIVFY